MIIPSCVLWLDANDPANTGAMPANNSAISSWIDKSGQRISFDQGTGSKQPTYIRNAVGSNSAVSFDGNNDALSNGSALTSILSRTGNSTICVAFQSALSSGVAGSLVSSYSSSSNRLTLMRSTSNFIGMYKYDGSAYTGANTSFTDTSSTHVEVGICNAGTLSNYLDNTLSVGTNTSGNTGGTVATTIGARTGEAGAFWQGYIMEVIIYSRVLSSDEQASITKYLANKWGILVF